MKRLLSDQWFQVFAAMTLMSGLVLGARHLRAAALNVQDAAARAAAAPASGAEKMVANAMNQAAQAAAVSASPTAGLPAAQTAGGPSGLPLAPGLPASPNAPAVSGGAGPQPQLRVTPPPAQNAGAFPGLGGFGAGAFGGGPAVGVASAIPSRHLGRPKRRGEWIIDAAGGPDSDGTSLRDAVFSAVGGDIITLRPGVYKDPIEPIEKDLVIRGQGPTPADVRVVVEDERVALRQGGGRLELRMLTVETSPPAASPSDPLPYAALSVEKGSAKLKDVVLKISGARAAALRVEQDGRVEMEGGGLAGTHADAMVRGGRARFTSVRFAHDIRPLIAWLNGSATVSRCDLRLGGRGALLAYDGGAIKADGDPRPRLVETRGDADRALDSRAFGAPLANRLQAQQAAQDASGLYQILPAGALPGGTQGAPSAFQPARSTRFKRDIFRPGRKPGDIQ